MLIRFLGVRFSHLVGGGYQINLFEDTEERINLYQAMDHIRKRFGEGKVKRATAMHLRHPKMNPFNGIAT